MSVLLVVAAVVGALTLVYVGVALLFPERLS